MFKKKKKHFKRNWVMVFIVHMYSFLFCLVLQFIVILSPTVFCINMNDQIHDCITHQQPPLNSIVIFSGMESHSWKLVRHQGKCQGSNSSIKHWYYKKENLEIQCIQGIIKAKVCATKHFELIYWNVHVNIYKCTWFTSFWIVKYILIQFLLICL